MVGTVIDRGEDEPLILVMAEGVVPMGNPAGRVWRGMKAWDEFITWA